MSLIAAVLVFAACVAGFYIAHTKIHNYKSDVLTDYNTLAALEYERNVLHIYNKILAKGSKESLQIQKHVLIDDRKKLLGLINQIEEYAKNNGLTENGNSPVLSVATRENAAITKYDAKDIVIEIKVVGGQKKIDDFLILLDNLPQASYMEKINSTKTGTAITLVIYQKNEVK